MVYRGKTIKKLNLPWIQKKRFFFICLYGMVLMQAIPGFAIEKITVPTTWENKVRVDKVIHISPPGKLKIKSGTTVTFKGDGRIECYNSTFSAVNVSFIAEQPIKKHQRIYIRNNTRDVTMFKNCLFKNIVSTDNPPNNAAVRTFFTSLKMIDCTLIQCSAFDVNHDIDSVYKGNLILQPVGTGFALCGGKYGQIINNYFESGPETDRLLFLRSSSQYCSVGSNRFLGAKEKTALFIHGDAVGNQICNNSFFDNPTGIYLGGKKIREQLISGNLFSNNGIGINIFSCGKNNKIQNCIMWKSTIYGMTINSDAQTVTVNNCVFLNDNQGIKISNKSPLPVLKNNCFWKNRNNFSPKLDSQDVTKENLFVDPGFVAPEEGNFRLKIPSFGYKETSPLINTGTPKGLSIGLFPSITDSN